MTDVEARAAHWDERYRTVGADRLSWFEPEPHQSLALLQMVDAGPSSSVIDIGGEASLLARCLVEPAGEVAAHVPLVTVKSGSTSIRTWIPSFEAISTRASRENFEILPR